MRNTVPVLKVEISQGMESWELPIVRVYVTEEGPYVLIEAMAFLEEAITQWQPFGLIAKAKNDLESQFY